MDLSNASDKRTYGEVQGKPMIPHLLRCQGFGVNYYSLTLDALHLQHPRLLQR